jgi:prepilin-type N-terminal cleavage/methylation domain-containing protein
MNRNLKKGFTLIELLTSVSIFAVVMIVSLGSITGIFNANRQTRSLKAVVNNLNLAMETMSKEIRYGTKYHCGEGTFELPQNCPEGGTILSFLSSDNEQITYRLAGTSLEKKVEDGDFAAVTAPELVLEDLKFYSLGSGTDNTLQPKIIVKLKGYSGTEKNRSELTLQTLISQRLVDEDPTAPYAYPYPTPEYPTPANFWDVVVSKPGTGSGTVSGPGINCGTTCEWAYANGSDVTLSASASSGSTFTGWSGACTGSGSCNLTMTADRAVTATFTLNAPPSMSWSGTASGNLDLNSGALKYFTAGTYNITVTASALFSFQGAAGGGSGSGGGACPSTTTPGSGGGGGGGGAVTNGTTMTLVPAKTYTLTVGAAGAATTLRNTTDNITLVSLNAGGNAGGTVGGTGGSVVTGSNAVTGGAGGLGRNGGYQQCYTGGAGGNATNGTGGGGAGETGSGACVSNNGGTGYGGNGDSSGAAPGAHSSGFGASQVCSGPHPYTGATYCSGRGGGGGGGAAFSSVPGYFGGGGAGGGGQSFDMAYDFCEGGPTGGNVGGPGVGVLYYQG